MVKKLSIAKYLLVVTIIVCALYTQAQTSYYWVKFSDKNNNWHSLSVPQTFLSFKSIERRTKQGIALDETDLPISDYYIEKIAPYTERIVHKLKWINTVVIAVSDNTFSADSILQFSFVDSLNKIEFPPSRSAKEKYEEITAAVVDHNYVYPNKYGIAYSQANMLNADLLHQLGYRGNGVTIAVMDNGFSNVNNIRGFDSIRTRILGTYDFVNHDEDVYIGGSHGTNVLSCIGGNIRNQYLGTAPDASFFLLQSEDTQAEWVMEEYNWAAAAEWADSAGAQIFSTSLGYTDFDDGIGDHTYADLTGDKTVITHAGNMAFDKGILVINSAGNEGANAWHYVSAPADGNKVMAVGAVDSTETIAAFSGRGPLPDGTIKPDVCAQGVRSAVITTFGDLGFSGGTSFSCPTLAGSAASLWGAFPDKSAQEISDAIKASCDRYLSPDNDYGYGIPDFYNAYLMLIQETDSSDVLPVGYGIKVFPNPSYNELYVSVFDAQETINYIDVVDMMGRIVLKQDHVFVREKTYGVIRIDEYANLAPGKYILRINGDKKKTVKVVKGTN